MAEKQNTEKKTLWKVHPSTVKRLKKEALLKRFSDGKKAAQEARNNTQSLPEPLDESQQGMENVSPSSSDTEVDMDESGITMFSTPSKEEEAFANSPGKGNCIFSIKIKVPIL